MQAWTEPARFAGWFGGRESDVPVDSVSMDLRPGGEWRGTMFAGPDRREIPWSGVFREVVEPERLVLTITDEPGDDVEELASRSDVLTVILTDLGDGRTEMVFHQGGGGLSEAGYAEAKAGWGVFFDTLDEDLGQGADADMTPVRRG